MDLRRGIEDRSEVFGLDAVSYHMIVIKSGHSVSAPHWVIAQDSPTRQQIVSIRWRDLVFGGVFISLLVQATSQRALLAMATKHQHEIL